MLLGTIIRLNIQTSPRLFVVMNLLPQIKKIDFVDNWFHVIQIIIKLIQLSLHTESKINNSLLYIISYSI